MTVEEFKTYFHSRYNPEYLRVLRALPQSDAQIWKGIETLLPVWGENAGVVVDRALKEEIKKDLDLKLRDPIQE